MNKGLEKYNHTEIPKELSQMINETIHTEKNRKKKLFSLIASAAAICVFTLSLNVSESFAETVVKIPLLGDVANVLIVREYSFEKEDISGEVNAPSITIGNEETEKYINETIEEKVSTVLEEATKRVQEYKDAFLETGGSQAQWEEKNMQVNVDYEIFLQDENYLSFAVFTNESLAAVYAEYLYFTIDLKTKELVTLQDLLGDDYVASITETVKAAVKQAPDRYFDNVKAAGWEARPDVNFYLNNQEQVVVIFEKYELAPGAEGRLSFIID